MVWLVAIMNAFGRKQQFGRIKFVPLGNSQWNFCWNAQIYKFIYNFAGWTILVGCSEGNPGVAVC